jgi:predicted ester cyclase
MNLNISKLHDEVINAWNQHDVKKVASYYDPSVVWKDIGFPEPFKGVDGVSKFFNIWLNAFPDFKIRTLTKIAAEDSIAVELEFSGTHTGVLKLPEMDVQPTHKRVTTRVACFATAKNGKWTGVNNYPDVPSMMVQLGLQPAHAEHEHL